MAEGTEKVINVVRFAPSPTGFLHVGGARTCLFNWLFAQVTKGKFILRIEDTDIKRSEKKYLDEILDSLQWLGMDWDELYHQSERFDIYKEYAKKLLDSAKAYREAEAIIYRVPKQIQIKFYDVLHGEIKIDTEQIKDQVLIKSDGTPAYNFSCVVDDALMGLTHIIRGDDHISNTPKQIMLYEALGFKLPKFVHIPMILGEDRSRLSKRHGATSISEYRKEGYLPQAMVNYLSLLGWSPGNNREILSLSTLAKEFSLKRINKTAAIFNIEKLNWLNGRYMRELNINDLMELLAPYLKEKGYISDDYDQDWLKGLITLYRTRFQTLIHFLKLAGFFFTETVHYDEQAVNKFLKTKADADNLEALMNVLEKTEPFQTHIIEGKIRQLISELNIPPANIIHPARVALTGGTVSPGIFEVIRFLGKEKSVKRLGEVTKKIRTRAEMFEKLDEL